MSYFEGLTENRKIFLNQLYNLVENQFKDQEKLTGEIENIIEILDSETDYIQRIFIDAPWGMGKSYFAKALVEKINSEKESNIKVIKINAWETDYYLEIMKSLISEINSSKKITCGKIKKIFTFIINIIKAIFVVGIGLLKKIFSKILFLNNTDILKIKNIFSEKNRSSLEEYKKYKKLIKDFKKDLIEDKNKKVIIIDELDRCKPSYAIELLETVKHLFGVKNLIFIFLVNKAQLSGVVSTLGMQSDRNNEYFEKFFDLELKLPEANYDEIIKFKYNEINMFDKYSDEEQRDNFLYFLFFEICEHGFEKKVSIRILLKLFKKYKLLLSSLSENEKSEYFLMIYLIIHYLKKELEKIFKSAVEEHEVIFKKTFFPKGSFIKKGFKMDKEILNLYLKVLKGEYSLDSSNIERETINKTGTRPEIKNGILLESFENKDIIKHPGFFKDSVSLKDRKLIKISKLKFFSIEDGNVHLDLINFKDYSYQEYKIKTCKQHNAVKIDIVKDWADKKCSFLNNVKRVSEKMLIV